MTDSAGSGGANRMGVGSERGLEAQRAQVRESMMALVPPTKEEVMRTVFVGKIPAQLTDETIERILKV